MSDVQEWYADYGITELRAEIARRSVELKQMRELLAEKVAAEPALTVYPSVEAIDWAAERLEDNDETRARYNEKFFQWALLGSNPKSDFYPPYKNVIVEGVGEVRKLGGTGWDAEKQRGGSAGPDWVHITQTRVLDVTAPQWVALVQKGDDYNETDPEDIEYLLKSYSGGLRYPLDAWKSHTVGAAYREIFLQTHTDPGVEYSKRQIPVTSAG